MLDGYGYVEGELVKVAGRLNTGADAMQRATSKPIEAPDAGASSEAVANTLSEIFSMAIGAEEVLRDVAGKVHTASGAYDLIENTNQGEVERQYWKDADSRVAPYKDRHGNPDDRNPAAHNQPGGN